MDRLDFIKGLYDKANSEIKEIYQQQKADRDELLKEIARILLVYTIVDNIITGVPGAEKIGLINLVTKLIKSECKLSEKTTEKILMDTSKSVFSNYSYNAGLKVTKSIVNDEFKGKIFSNRVWDNGQDTAKELESKINRFIKGEINVNQIKKEVETTFNKGAYNTKRLVDTEVSRVQNESFLKFCDETGVKKVKYNATLDSKTCNDCAQFDNNIYDYGKQPDLPRHPMCRCFYEIADDNNKNNALTVSNKEYNKNIEVPLDNKIMNGMDIKTKDNIIQAVNNTMSKYDVKLDEIKVFDLGEINKNVPFQYQPINRGGFLYNTLVINEGYYFNGNYDEFVARIQRNYNKGVLAARNIDGLIDHELAHVMTFQRCDRYGEFESLEDEIRGKFVSGVSIYADSTFDGAESIAEAFVRLKNGEDVPQRAKELVEKYIERWKK